MNPLLTDVLAFLSDRRQVTEIRPDTTGRERHRVEFVFTEGPSESRVYECDDSTYLTWWEQALSHVRSTNEAFREEGKRLER